MGCPVMIDDFFSKGDIIIQDDDQFIDNRYKVDDDNNNQNNNPQINDDRYCYNSNSNPFIDLTRRLKSNCWFDDDNSNNNGKNPYIDDIMYHDTSCSINTPDDNNDSQINDNIVF